MRDCEQYEVLISAWHDSELDWSGQVAMLDHLVRCAGCKEFYLSARGLAGLVAAVHSPVGESPSPEVWRRIERSVRSAKLVRLLADGAWRRWLPGPAWGAAAVVAVFLVVFSSTLGKARISPNPREIPTEIRLGENPEGMDDARFVELTKRVLGADRKYRTAFYEIMRQVVEDTEGTEPSGDLLPRQQERRREAEAPESVGGPS